MCLKTKSIKKADPMKWICLKKRKRNKKCFGYSFMNPVRT